MLRLFVMPGSFDGVYPELVEGPRMTKLRGALPRFFRLIKPGACSGGYRGYCQCRCAP